MKIPKPKLPRKTKSLDEKMRDSKIKTQKLKDDFKYCISRLEKGYICLPYFLPNEKKTLADTVYTMNLNGYRNRNFIVSNNIKIQFKEWIEDQIKDLVIKGKFRLEYKIYRKQKLDGANVYTVVDKFFCDTLVESGCIEDDNIKILEGGSWIDGGQDKLYPRVEVRIVQ